jgi:hypothetical protein
MTARSLPPNASLRHLRNEAKSVLKAHADGKGEVCDTLRLLPRLADKPDGQVLASPVTLQEVQHALAVAYGFRSWAELRKHVQAGQAEPAGNAGGPNGRYLADAVDMTHRLIENEEHAGRCHLVHVLFSMRAAGWGIDCPTLMCVTGTAFSFWYQHDNYHVAYSLPHGWEQRLAEATGFGYEYLDHEAVEDAWRHLVTSIDSGRLVNGEWMEGVTFAGYEAAGEPEDRKVFAVDETFEWPGAWWGWEQFARWYEEWAKPFRWLGRHSRRIATPSPRESALAVLKGIPEWAGEYDEGRQYAAGGEGLAGIAAYAADIADTSKRGDYIAGPWRGCHAINPLWTARRLPPVYLRRAAREFDGQARQHVLAAADRYAAAYEAWQEWNRRLGGAVTGGEDADGTPPTAWDSPDARAAGAAAVRQALEHERAAVAAIKEALAATGT